MAAGDPIVTCDNKELVSLDTLKKAVVHKDADGKPFINVVIDDIDCADISPALNCDNHELETEDSLWRACFVFDACGNLALRLGKGTP